MLLKYIIILISFLIISSCQTINNRGQYIDDETINKLKNSSLSKQEVVQLVGTPTFIPDYSPDSYYYIFRSLSNRAWFTSQIKEQRILKVTFDKHDKLKGVIILEDFDKYNINIKKGYTPTLGTELNPVQKFVKNIGRFNKTPRKKRVNNN